MSATDSGVPREAIRRTLAQLAGDDPTASAVAEATLGTWHQMAARLAPVIGARGVDALFGRSLRLTRAAFPSLTLVVGDDDSGAAQFENFLARLQACDAAAAAEVSNALLLTFTELLVSLIGQSLTGRLLAPVWAPPPQASEQETAA